jgi:hypothetical protein
MQAARVRHRQRVAVKRRDLSVCRGCRFAQRRLNSSASPLSLAIELPPLEPEFRDDQLVWLAGKIATTENRRLATQGIGLARMLGGLVRQRIDDALDDSSNAPERCAIESSIGLLGKEIGD